MKNKVTLLNIISGFILQVVTVISGFIIPKIMLSYFGSEVYGLVSSINQLLNYVTLIEGGLSAVVLAQLYKPVINNDEQSISKVVVAAKSFFRKIAVFFLIYTLIVGFLYTYIFNVRFSQNYVFSLTLILSSTLMTQYMFSLTYRLLLTSCKKSYIISFTQIVSALLNILLAILSVRVFPSVHFFKIMTGIVYLVQPAIYYIVVSKIYKINWKSKKDSSILSARWDGFVVNLAAFVHGSTDIIILTLLTNLQTVSVYSIYSLVSKSLSSLIGTCTSALTVNVGQVYAKNNHKELRDRIDLQEFITLVFVFFFFTVGILLVTPFVILYTKGSSDANFFQPWFGILLLISEAINLLKAPYIGLANSANKFRAMKASAFIEAIINIIVSIVLVKYIGLIGVVIGTIISMCYRLLYQIKFTSFIVEGRKQKDIYKKIMIFLFASVLDYLLCVTLFPINYHKLTVVYWILYACVYSVIVLVMILIISITIFKKEMKYLYLYLKR